MTKYISICERCGKQLDDLTREAFTLNSEEVIVDVGIFLPNRPYPHHLDLCPSCMNDFVRFMKEKENEI